MYGYPTFVSVRINGEGIVLGRVGYPDDDHAPCVGPKILRMASLLALAGKPSHVTVEAFSYEVNQSFPNLWPQACGTEADRIKTYLECFVADLAGWVCRA
jgi:hypothetical protein